jgi:hypothetical protein
MFYLRYFCNIIKAYLASHNFLKQICYAVPEMLILLSACCLSSVAEPHHFYAAPAPGKNFDAAPALAPTLLYSKAKFLKRTKF